MIDLSKIEAKFVRTLNFTYTTIEELEKKISSHADLFASSNILVQIFAGDTNPTKLQTLLEKLANFLPQAVVIGTSTAGEILDSNVSDRSIVLSFAFFDHTHVIPLFTPQCNEMGGFDLAKQINKSSIKAALLFSEGLHGDPEGMLTTLSNMHPDLIVAGGAAADNSQFIQTLLIHGTNITEHGVVGVAFDNPELIISTTWFLNFTPIGKTMQITKANGTQLFEIDHRPIYEVISNFFGKEALENVPHNIIHFPLLKMDQDILIARAPVATIEDGLIYAGKFSDKEKVRFGIVDIENLITNATNAAKTIKKRAIEGLWIYSCIGRRTFLSDKLLREEFARFAPGVSNSGFFTYGEFYHNNNKNFMFNFTTTIFALSEGENRQKELNLPSLSNTFSPLIGLINLVNSTSKELENTISFLEGYKLATDESSVISKTDPNGIITYVNDIFCKISGFKREELIGKNHNIIRHPNTPKSLYSNMWTTIKAKRTWRGILANRSKDGSTFYLDTTIVPLLDQNKNIVEYIAIRHDITKLINQEQIIREQRVDPLTGLPNRTSFLYDLQSATAPAVAIFNIDRFRDINNFYGFEIGDRLLIEFARTLVKAVSPKILVYHLGSDLFLAYSPNLAAKQFEIKISMAVNLLHKHTFEIDDIALNVQLSVGIAYGSEQILTRAEEALHQARTNHISITTVTLEEEKNRYRNFLMMKIVRKAVEHGRVIPYFQPIVDAKTDKIVKYEALVRIQDENDKIYSPSEFLDLIKGTTLYPELTKAIISTSISLFSNHSEGLTINLSMLDITNEKLISYLKDQISSFFQPSRLTLEITESEAIKDYAYAKAFIDEMRALGVKIAIDDFGSGYSNFSYIVQLNPDYLKIDGSIVKNITTSKPHYQTLMAIIDFAKRLNIATVAEFVSDIDIANAVKKMGVDLLQGFYFGKPQPLHIEKSKS